MVRIRYSRPERRKQGNAADGSRTSLLQKVHVIETLMWEYIHLRLAAIVALEQGNETEDVNSHLRFLHLPFSVLHVLYCTFHLPLLYAVPKVHWLHAASLISRNLYP